MKILLTTASLDLEGGGPSENVAMLALALHLSGASVALLSGRPGRFHPLIRERKLTLFVPGTMLGIRAYRTFASGVFDEFRPDVVHDNGLWLPENHSHVTLAKRKGRKLVVSVRGMLEPWALQYRTLKKRIAWLVYEGRDLRSVDLLVATSEQERSNILKLLPGAKVRIVPNGWSPAFHDIATESERPVRTALFFSRIHVKKGIEVLLDAWAAVRPTAWMLRIVGPGEEAYVGALKKRAVSLGLRSVVTFEPPVYDRKKKDELMASADLFVLPSYSENFGSVVVEAMGLGVPVITTTATPWNELVEQRAGWWVQPTVRGLSEALADAISLSDAERRHMGERGKNLVEQKYLWSAVAERMLNVYGEVLKG